jgi:hypothetical protein
MTKYLTVGSAEYSLSHKKNIVLAMNLDKNLDKCLSRFIDKTTSFLRRRELSRFSAGPEFLEARGETKI